MKDFLSKYQKVTVEESLNNIIENPLISICVVTYNQANYIKNCLDSVLRQKTNFNFEILLGEDASSDGTREICMEYAQKHTDKIRLFLHHRENNIKISGNPSGRFNLLYNLLKARGKYIALCEGDDYWTDPYKLQKQVDFLEENPEYSMCVHNAIVHFEDVEDRDHFFNSADQKSIIKTEDLINNWSFATASILFRASLLPNMGSYEALRIHNGDLFLSLMVSLNGPIKYIPNVMSVYRRSNYAIRNKSFRKPGKNYNRHYIIDKKIEMLIIFDGLSNGIYTKQIENKIEQLRKSRKRAELYYRYPIIKYLRPKKIFEFLMRSLFKS